MKHKRVVVSAYGGPEVLEVIEEQLPEPAKGEVRVKVLAAGVAYGDIVRREIEIPFEGFPKIPFSPGYDVAGLVDAVGEDVSGLSTGQTVAGFAINPPGDLSAGGYAEYVCVPETWMVRLPGEVDFAEAACVVLNYLTAYRSLMQAQIDAGERLLVIGASGGVGTAALQLGKFFGLELYGTASTEKLDLVRGLGATPIDYKSKDVVEQILALTDGEGVDVVLDGAAGDALEQSYATLRDGGRMIIFGDRSLTIDQFKELDRSEADELINSLDQKSDKKSVKNYAWFEINIPYREQLLRLLHLLAEGHVKPVIHERIPLEEARRAHELLEGGAVHGKLVLIPEAGR